MPDRVRTNQPIATSLPALLKERGLSLRQLGQMVGVNQSYLSRIMGDRDAKTWRPPSRKVLVAIADVLQIPPDYFPEFREIVVGEAIAKNARLRDRFYDSLPRTRRAPS